MNWEKYKVNEFADVIGGGTPKTSVAEYWDGDIPWLSVKDFNDDYRTVSKTEKTITKKGLENSSTKLLKKGDLIISARGTVGALAQLGKDMAFNQSCYGLRAKEDFENTFIYYLLKNELSQILSNTHGSVFDTITRETFESIKAFIPPLPEQRAISEILSSIDDKIELNNQMNRTLEAMAQAIFKQWFVDFEFPITLASATLSQRSETIKESSSTQRSLSVAEMSGYKSSGGKMIDSEMGPIPEGWRVGTIDDIAEVVGGGTPSTKVERYFAKDAIPWITPKDLSGYTYKYIQRGSTDITEEALRNSSARMLPTGTVLFSSRAPIGYIAIAENSVSTNQGFKSLIPKNGIKTEYLYQYIKMITPDIEGRASGSTFKEISGSAMKQIKVIVPENGIIDSFEEIIKPLNGQIQIIKDQDKTLSTLRDTLLPKLMSGELRVPEEIVKRYEEAVSEV